MEEKMRYKTSGVCSNEIIFEIDQETNTIASIKFNGGCPGNTSGIAKLVTGMPVDEVIQKLEGTKCGFKSTSCPDQLANALKKWRSAK
jgi:uncharacterized protein (TIGR03905 family)